MDTQTPAGAAGGRPSTGIRFTRGEAETGGRLRVSVPAAPSTGRAVERLRALPPDLFLVPGAVEEHASHLELGFPAEPEGTVPLALALPGLRGSPESVVVALSLARFLLEASQAAQEAVLPFVVCGPTLVRYTPRAAKPWRLAAVPGRGLTLGDWARSEQELLGWMAPEVLLSGEVRDAAYLAGAALLHWFSGDGLPAGVTGRERLHRAVRGRVEGTGRLAEGIVAALPTSLSEEAGQLERLIREVLPPAPSRRNTAAVMEARLTQLEQALPARRLATRWEYEGRRDLALALLERLSGFGPAGTAFDLEARLREEGGDLRGALAAWRRSFEAGEEEALRGLVGVLRRAAFQPLPERALVAEGLAVLDARRGEEAAEALRLSLADIEARALGEKDRAAARLQAPHQRPWNEARRLLLLARLLAERGDCVGASKRVQAGLRILESGPDGQHPLGRYVRAYLLLVDGVANFGAIGTLNEPRYLAECYPLFAGALTEALEIGAKALAEAAVHWLGFIVRYAQQLALPVTGTVKLGVEAFLQSRDLLEYARSPRFAGMPPLPWYDGDALFPEPSSPELRGQ
ncbi:hypothetical protein [Pyxidicoccus caerfyrddinensis]|uniref:hypothetical protein n=1 Tax=Pyxidicoccus caerfyrddinensis TaxID=2709663 RepID=UPI0013DCCEB7|nr:hypothetical protein [Pyxidicoccus caerfyrddinensis]